MPARPKKKPRKKAPGARSRSASDRATELRPPKQTLQRKQSELRALLAQRVRDARARRFMTRKALARESGISIAYLARVESGAGNISLGLLQQLALALNLPLESFLAAASGVIARLLLRRHATLPGRLTCSLAKPAFDA